jgi:hypothetical protein
MKRGILGSSRVETMRRSSKQKMFVILLMLTLLGGSAGISIAVTEAFLPAALALLAAVGALSMLYPKLIRKRK